MISLTPAYRRYLLLSLITHRIGGEFQSIITHKLYLYILTVKRGAPFLNTPHHSKQDGITHAYLAYRFTFEICRCWKRAIQTTRYLLSSTINLPCTRPSATPWSWGLRNEYLSQQYGSPTSISNTGRGNSMVYESTRWVDCYRLLLWMHVYGIVQSLACWSCANSAMCIGRMERCQHRSIIAGYSKPL
jgi:hypothetical protein